MLKLNQLVALLLLVSVPAFAGDWATQESGTMKNLEGMFFIDENTGIAVGDQGTIIRSVDGGETWSLEESGTSERLLSVCMTGGGHAIAVGGDGVILKSMDGGISWVQKTSSTSENLRAVSFANMMTGMAVGNNGTILTTDDGGESWSSQESGVSTILYAAQCYDENYAMAVGQNGTVLLSTDGGVSWIELGPGTSQCLKGISIPADSVIYLVGDNGTILKSVDWGSSWISQVGFVGPRDGIDYPTLWGISFSDEQTGILVGAGGSIMRTIDGGTSWSSESAYTIRHLNAVQMIGVEAITVGDKGIVMKYAPEGMINHDNRITTGQPDGFDLGQNYPNPFNPSTTINFTISEPGFATLKVFNTLGEEVATLVSSTLSAGTHTVHWNAAQLASGVYLYQLRTENSAATKRLILSK